MMDSIIEVTTRIATGTIPRRHFAGGVHWMTGSLPNQQTIEERE